jgi:hypothetical protein
MRIYRVSVLGCLVGLLNLSSFNGSAQAIDSPSTYPEAIGFFAQEKTIGESGAALLKTFREKMAMGDYVGGVQRYAKAKAAFDGLIHQLAAEAGEVQDRANSERFQEKLREAAEARIAFTSYVETTLGPKLEGTRFPFTVIFETVAEILPKLVDAWNKLWDARRQAQEARKQEVRQELDAVAWRPFNDIEAIQ